jgi:zinc protease
MRKSWLFGIFALVFLFVAHEIFSVDTSALSTLDPSVRSGVLPNGMRYYVLKNPVPAKRVEMRLVVRAGSLQEGPGEHGLAHLVEHLEFEGTSRYKPLEIISYMESIGMAFGPEVNGFTNYNGTGYLLSIPTTVPGAIEKGIDILDDWARGPVVTADIVEKEKKIVSEEYRMRVGNTEGRYQLALEEMKFEGSPFANHSPLGLPEDISRFTLDAAQGFVDRFYTVDAMSVVIVGDIDPGKVVSLLKRRFTSDYGRQNGARSIAFPAFASAQKDSVRFFDAPDLGSDRFVWYTVLERVSGDLKDAMLWDLKADIAFGALNQRLAEVSLRAESGIKEASVRYEWVPGQGRGVIYELVPRDGMREAAITSFFAELKRASAFGVTQGEYDLGRSAFNGIGEAYLTQKANTKSAEKASRIVSAIVDDDYYVYTQEWYEARKAALSKVGKQDVDEWLAHVAIPVPARLLVGTVAKKGSRAPTEGEIGAVIRSSLAAEVTPVAEKPAGALIEAMPARGKIVKSEKIAGTPFTKWTLSNGIVAYLYRNDTTRNDFKVRAFSAGGLSLIDDADFWTGTFASQLLARNGAGGLDEQGLAKFLSGMRSCVLFSVDDNHAALWGKSDPADPNDMERFFKLLYARLASPRRDPIAERAVRGQIAEWYANNATSPDFLYSNEIDSLLSSGNPRFTPLDAARAASLDPERAAQIMSLWYGNPADLTFVITGEYDETALKGLVETWLASIPARPASNAVAIDRGIRACKGPLARTVRAGKDDKSVVTILRDAETPCGTSELQLAYILRNVIDLRLTDALRQVNAGTYTVSVRINLFSRPYPLARTTVRFTCDPKNRDSLIAAAKKELGRISAGDIDDATFGKAVAIQKQTIRVGEKTNDYWNVVMFLALVNGYDIQETLSIKAFADSVTKKDLADFAARVIGDDDFLIAVLEPEAR